MLKPLSIYINPNKQIEIRENGGRRLTHSGGIVGWLLPPVFIVYSSGMLLITQQWTHIHKTKHCMA